MIDEPSEHSGTAEARLAEAVSAFRNWADCYPVGERSGEWECDYDQWPSITSAFTAFLDSGVPQRWNASVIEMLLYILARDNEMEMLKEELITRPAHLVVLARAALRSTEQDARWQLADALGSIELPANEVEPLLVQLFHDRDEYVSRRALLALARRQTSEAEALALRAWSTEHEYQRMAALEALFACRSPLLQSHLDLAERDGRQHLVNAANKLRSK
ncbi:HEAT repeat domain-containing protein [Bradyrhizobium sp. 14AA]